MCIVNRHHSLASQFIETVLTNGGQRTEDQVGIEVAALAKTGHAAATVMSLVLLTSYLQSWSATSDLVRLVFLVGLPGAVAGAVWPPASTSAATFRRTGGAPPPISSRASASESEQSCRNTRRWSERAAKQKGQQSIQNVDIYMVRTLHGTKHGMLALLFQITKGYKVTTTLELHLWGFAPNMMR